MKAAVVGAAGYLGGELLRLLAGHPALEAVCAQGARAAGEPVATAHPTLARWYPDLVVGALDPEALSGCDVVFCALPAGEAQRIVPELVEVVPLVVDLGPDFRLGSAAAYEQWYGFVHEAPGLLSSAVCGLPELFRAELEGARLVAVPGCFVTAAVLALQPLLATGALERETVIVDAASGVSGAGREPTEATHFAAVNESFVAYGLLSHRHTPEIEALLGTEVLFTPHLAPMTRGILVTAYGRLRAGETTASLLGALRQRYSGEHFVEIVDDPPATRQTWATNLARITARADLRTGHGVVVSAIDNLTKGGAGQGVQAANVALGLDEAAGLATVAALP